MSRRGFRKGDRVVFRQQGVAWHGEVDYVRYEREERQIWVRVCFDAEGKDGGSMSFGVAPWALRHEGKGWDRTGIIRILALLGIPAALITLFALGVL